MYHVLPRVYENENFNFEIKLDGEFKVGVQIKIIDYKFQITFVRMHHDCNTNLQMIFRVIEDINL